MHNNSKIARRESNGKIYVEKNYWHGFTFPRKKTREDKSVCKVKQKLVNKISKADYLASNMQWSKCDGVNVYCKHH